MKTQKLIVIIICILIIVVCLYLAWPINNLSQANKIALYVGIIGSIATIIALILPDLFKKDENIPAFSPSIDRNNNIQQNANGNNITQNIGIPPELHKKWIDEKDQKYEERLREKNEHIKKYKEVLKDLALKKETMPNYDLTKEAEKAYSELKTVNFTETEKLYNRLYDLKKQAIQKDIHGMADCAYQLGNINYAIEEYLEAKKWYEEAVRLVEDNGIYINSLGLTYYILGEYDKAIEFFNKALLIGKKVYPDEILHPDIAIRYNNIGSAYFSKTDCDKAIEFYNKALLIYKKIYPDEKHPCIALGYNNIGSAYDFKKDYDKAIDFYNKALLIDKKFYPDEMHHDIANDYHNIGLAYGNKGEYDKAIEFFNKALLIDKNIYPAEIHPDISACYNNIGLAYDKKGEYDKAIEFYNKALEILYKFFPKGVHPYIKKTYNNLSIVYSKMGNNKLAEEYSKKAMDIEQKLQGKK